MKRDTGTRNGPLKKSVVLLDNQERQFVLSPVRLMTTLVLSIFTVEMLIMLALEHTEPPGWKETLIDSTVLTATLFTILYYSLFKPLVVLVREYKNKENQLKDHKERLEFMVQERTGELNAAYIELKNENEKTLKVRTALQESEDRFRQIFEQSEDAIILFNTPDGSVIDMNPTAEQVFRRQKQDVLSGGIQSLCTSGGQENLASILQKIDRDNVAGVIEKFECPVAADDTRILSFHGKKIRLQGTEVIYTTFRDITTRIRMEEEAREIQARLIQANRMTSLGTMVSSVAHEINNPNNFLLLNAGIIKRAWQDIAPVVERQYQATGDFAVARSMWSEARSFLPDAIEGIQQGALRISAIVGNLKEFGRDNRFRPESRADVNAVVQLSVSILNHHISRATEHFRIELAEALPQVRGSARQLEQVVINLIQNSLQALPGPECAVRVSTSLDHSSGQVLIRVADEGNGIPPEIAERIMEPFFTTRLEHGGTGLGLAISSTIVKEHDGSIEFSSGPGGGTTFTVRLCPVESNDSRAPSEELHETI